jgi:PAS domain S-box-containing protein
MSDAVPPLSFVRVPEARAPGYIGPLIPDKRWPLRYFTAFLVVAATVAMRAVLAPSLGTQAPLLPFVLTVFVSAYLGGRGPALLAAVLAPVAATFWFTAWPHDAPPGQWAAHVTFFLLIGALAAVLMGELQRNARAQRLAMHAAAESAQQARESAAQMKLITDGMPALISYIDQDRVFRFANRMYEKWFGIPASAVAGRQMREVLGEAAYKLVAPRLDRALKGERVFFEEDMPYEAGARQISAHYIPDISPDGRVRGCFALIEDVSARKRAERALREMDRRKDDFLAMLSHELRNPLTPIRNVAHILARGQVDTDTIRRSAELLERQASQLARLVDDLLDVARITRGRIPLRREPLNLASVLDTALEAVKPLLEFRAQKVSVTRDEDALFVDADRVRLCQVVSNLLTNAIKYSPDGARIEVRLQSTPGEVSLIVRDEGAGIDPQMLPQIFDLYLQGDESVDRSQGGLGIGLTVVKHLVEMHGGRVQAHSEGLGKGSEFRAWLPRIPAVILPAPDQPGKISRAVPRRRVLVVEDSRDAAESLRQLLRLDDHEVEVAHDGASALSKLDEFRADVVLLDIGLPRLDGFMVAHAIRARFANMPVRPRLVALTGHAREEDRHATLRSGFDGHLSKPVEPGHLLRMIAGEGMRQTSSSERG